MREMTLGRRKEGHLAMSQGGLDGKEARSKGEDPEHRLVLQRSGVRGTSVAGS